MSLTRLKNKYFTGSWVKDYKGIFNKVNEVVDYLTTPKIYKAILYQSGDTSAPTATVYENTLGNLVWTRSDVGLYLATLNGTFLEGKVFQFIQMDDMSIKRSFGRDSDNALFLEQVAALGDTPIDGLNYISIIIEVYP